MFMDKRGFTLRTLSLCIALALLGALAAPLSAGASGGNPPVGAPEYVSLHKYATRTDEPGVYKVRLDISNNQKFNVAPVFITFVLDASPSMYHTHLSDTPAIAATYGRMPTENPAVDQVSRWEGAWAGLRAALDIFGNPDDNLAYEHTYVSIVSFDANSARAYTSEQKQGWTFERKAATGPPPTEVMSRDELPNFAASDLTASIYVANRNSAQNPGLPGTYNGTYGNAGNAGFVNISEVGMYNAASNTRGKLLESVPRYPYMTFDLVQNNWNVNPALDPGNGNYWFLDTSGTATGHGMKMAYDLMKETYNIPTLNGVDTDDFQRFVIFLGDGQDNNVGHSTMGQFYATALKAPTTTTLQDSASNLYPGMNTEVWTIGMGLDLNAPFGDSDFYRNQSSWATFNYLGTQGTAWRNGTDYEYFLTTYAAGSPISSTAWPNSYIEPHLITFAARLNNQANYASFPTTINTTNATHLQNIFDFYATQGVDKANTVYEHASGGYPGATGGKSAVEIFREYAQRIVVGRNVKATDIIGHKFEIYSPAGVPSYELTGTLKDGSTTERWDPGTITISGRTISWNIPAIPNDGGTISLSYYVKLDPSADPSLYYNTNEEAYLEYDRKGILSLGEDPTLDYHVKKYFPMPYASPNNGEKVEQGQGESSSTGAINTGTGDGYTGHDGHQDNRESNKDMNAGSGWGGVLDVNPDVTAVKAGKDSSDRDKVYVDLSNGSYMRYQWQFKNAAGEWEDIFGANASHYTLGKQFTLNQLYELRCKITNPAGKITYTDSIEAKRSTEGNAGLQAKEDGPNIEGESLMDAGEEITVANTATNGQILAILAGAAILALAIAGGVAIRRRVKR